MSEARHDKAHEDDHGNEPMGEPDAGPDAAPAIDAPQSREDQLESQLAEFESKYLRALADYQNFQRRAHDNEVKARQYGAAAVARSLVPALEHFDIAAGHDLASMPAEKLIGAGSMLQEELLKGLAEHGVERVAPAVGDEFNPHFHEAVMQQAADGVASGHVSMCLQAGYRLRDQPIRSAKVAVAP
ncbi:MAG: nucleotide exchange factor GrpE [Planctomycetota bacterium]|nr:nucleotide exchange factor GrpE [Planctomycetota bacterium]